MGRSGLSVFLLSGSAPLLAADAASLPGSGELAGPLLKMLLGLLLVSGAILLLAWGLRRLQGLAPRQQVIRLLASLPLGPRERLLLVEVGAQQLLLGVAPGRISLLHALEEPVSLPASEPASPEFARRQLEALGQQSGRRG